MDTALVNQQQTKKMRSSNLELFRIISMFLIVAHHYVVNSGILPVAKLQPMAGNSIFLFLFGAWGKIGINCFVLITGYFMCKSNITLKKFLKLVFEIMFYRVVIYFIFVISGYEAISITGLAKAFLPVYKIGDNFPACFLMFYLCIPFLNILIKNLNEKMHVRLLLLSGFIYVFLATMPVFSVTMNYVSWFIVLYFIASYVRLYDKKIFNKTLLWGLVALCAVLLSSLSVIGGAWLGPKINKDLIFKFVTDSNTFLAVLTGFSSFMFFKNLKIKNSKIINTVASTCFGILLIHANSATMRNWLWKDVLNVAGQYNSAYLIIHALVSVVAIFVICALIDLFRIHILEKLFFRFWDKIEPKLKSKYSDIEDKLCKKFHIGE